jgi:hypothetical protein
MIFKNSKGKIKNLLVQGCSDDKDMMDLLNSLFTSMTGQ